MTPFETFWAVYPRHEHQGEARKAFAAALTRASPADIIAGALRYRDDPNREPRFTCGPRRWLEGQSWLDDPLPPPAERSRRSDSVPDPDGTLLARMVARIPAMNGGARALHP